MTGATPGSDVPVIGGSCVPPERGAATFGWLATAVLTLACGAVAVAQEQPPMPAGSPAMKSLGNERYQVGAIVVDRAAGSFVVPGRVLHLDEAPLEYIATSPDGMKAYETLLEVVASGTEFNLACILLGLENAERRRPDYQFDRRPPVGPAVQLQVRWQEDGKTVTRSIHEVLRFDGEGGPPPPPGQQGPPRPPGAPGGEVPAEEWVYIGSYNRPDGGAYVADGTGTLVGFVHDPASIIEHRSGLGIGAYGSVRGNAEVLPPIGGAIELVVTVPRGRE